MGSADERIQGGPLGCPHTGQFESFLLEVVAESLQTLTMASSQWNAMPVPVDVS